MRYRAINKLLTYIHSIIIFITLAVSTVESIM